MTHASPRAATLSPVREQDARRPVVVARDIVRRYGEGDAAVRRPARRLRCRSTPASWSP